MRELNYLLIISLLWGMVVPTGFAKPKETYDPNVTSVAVVSYPTGAQSKALLEETAAKLRQKLENIPGVHVVESNTALDIATYHGTYVQKNEGVSQGERYLSTAKIHWFDREYREAEANVDRAIDAFKSEASQGALLVDAYLTKVLIFQETKRYDETKNLFEEILKVDPSLTLEGLPIMGRSRKMFQATKKEIEEKYSGTADIKTEPAGVSVSLNGILKGVTPLKIKIPEGTYLLTLDESHYQRITEPLYIVSNNTQTVERKMKWANKGSTEILSEMGSPFKTKDVVQNETKRFGELGDLLKVDKVVIVSSEIRGGKEVAVVRTVDTNLKASLKPINVSLSDLQNSDAQTEEKLFNGVVKQAKISILDNPSKYLDEAGDVRTLKRKSGVKSPFFYSLIGTLIGGAIVTGVTLLMKDDGNSSAPGESSDVGGVIIKFE